MNTCPNCGMVKGLHASILPGCICPFNDLASLKYKQTVGPIESAMQKMWFDGEKVVTQNIPASAIYKHTWDVAACKAYAEQLRDKTRANTAEHAAEAIEFLLAECDALHKEIDGNHAMMERQTARIVDLQTHIENFDGEEG